MGTSSIVFFDKKNYNLQLIYTSEKTSDKPENHYTCVELPYNSNGAIESR